MTEEDRRQLDLPDRRQNTYEELSKRLDEHLEHLENRLRRFFMKALAAFAVLGLTSAGSLLGFGIVLSKQKQTSIDIQKQRFDAFYLNCSQQNDRHTKVSHEIDKAIAAIPAGEKRDEAQKSSGPFRLIIGAAVPYTPDCKAYALERVKGKD